jgi:NAD(P)-dependent dehydrogenase (short-subunit alcohol dehydrogenase family)
MAVVLVTGGSSGIGLATVKRLAAAGHQVFCGSRDPARASLPGAVIPLPMDIADPAAAPAAIRAVAAAAGRLDVLVNNAGTVSIGALEEAGDPEAHRIFEVNLFGPMRLVSAALPIMRAQGSGRIINVTSENDTLPAPFGGWYSASKAALASVSTVLDAEVHGLGISVTVVAPGLFRTAMADRLPEFEIPAGSAYAPALAAVRDQNAAGLADAGDPDEVARAIEDCIAASDPPARIVVGADAVDMDRIARQASADELARLMRGFVADLTRQPAAGRTQTAGS